MDVLADVLAVSGIRGTTASRIEAGDGWSVQWAENADAVFYALTSGAAWLRISGREPRRLLAGDVVLLPGGVAHVLSSDPATPVHACDLAAADAARETGGVLRLGAGDVRTRVLGATYRYDRTVSTQVFALLPDVVHIAADNGGSCLDDTVRLLARELAHPQPATAVILDRLVDILLIQLLRVWLDARPPEAQGRWLAALGDPVMTEALSKLHQQPARSWTTEELATELAVSRATLSRRFQAVIGQQPGAYLTQWRMDLAARRLRDTDDTLDSIAHAVGYTSVYAFSRAFHRARNEPPGRYRVTSRAVRAA
jgi:AraC-like DNA-binding protein